MEYTCTQVALRVGIHQHVLSFPGVGRHVIHVGHRSFMMELLGGVPGPAERSVLLLALFPHAFVSWVVWQKAHKGRGAEGASSHAHTRACQRLP